jgi:hypothetical protein
MQLLSPSKVNWSYIGTTAMWITSTHGGPATSAAAPSVFKREGEQASTCLTKTASNVVYSGQRVQPPPSNLIDDTLHRVSYDQDHLYLEWNNHHHATILSIPDLQRSRAQGTNPRVTPQAVHTLRQHDFDAVANDDTALLQWLDSLARDGACLVNHAPSNNPSNHPSHDGDDSFGVVTVANRISQPQVRAACT